MNPSLYYFRAYFKNISIAGAILSIIAGIFKLISGSSIFLLMFFIAVLSFFQYRWFLRPYIELRGAEILIRLTMVISQKINLLEVKKIDFSNRKKIILQPKVGKKVIIRLNYLTKEDRNKLLLDLLAISDGQLDGDFSLHLVED